MKTIGALACALVLTGCIGAPAPGVAASGDAFLVKCVHGKTFDVAYRDGSAAAVVHAGGKVYVLPAVMAASGERYSDGKSEYWEHHGDAMLSGVAGGPYADCRVDRPPT